jgi:uncharacterized BrkB/YihY/UPF0761 family membrane protein
MIEKKLSDYIRQQTQEGVTINEIRKALLASGWQSDIVDKAFSSIFGVPPQPKKSQAKKIILIIASAVVFFILLIVFLPNILGLFSKDTDVIGDSDLKLKVIMVP